MKPWEYRPRDRSRHADEYPDGSPEDGGWEPNATSNTMAWASDKLGLSDMCEREGWLFSLADKLWAECSCCYFYRGVIIGIAFSFFLFLTVVILHAM